MGKTEALGSEEVHTNTIFCFMLNFYNELQKPVTSLFLR